ncbi:hypothetical protein Tsubulata_011771 [Turnera subulata]|uniref:USP domain-containing protein n=1 Tax=Turnera subulata TaxID=218843 RepID=A0A9Q0GEX1_9ROSI|nr:hypothetical protein Tsubulata_011771 [Turnera subulata]
MEVDPPSGSTDKNPDNQSATGGSSSPKSNGSCVSSPEKVFNCSPNPHSPTLPAAAAAAASDSKQIPAPEINIFDEEEEAEEVEAVDCYDMYAPQQEWGYDHYRPGSFPDYDFYPSYHRHHHHSGSWGQWSRWGSFGMRNWERMGNRVDRVDAPTRPTGMGAGLHNLGNTCFMNGILQCLTHTVPFVKALRSCEHTTPCFVDGFCVLCNLREHVNLCLASSGKTVSPRKLARNLHRILYFFPSSFVVRRYMVLWKCVFKIYFGLESLTFGLLDISSTFLQYQQEDAHEYLTLLLDKVGSCLESNSDCKNMVEQLFVGRTVNKLRCCNCGNLSHMNENFDSLSLAIEAVDTLQGALETFTKVEKMEDEEEKVTCEECKEKVFKERQLLLDQVPPIVTLQLKRFKTVGTNFVKDDKSITFPLELDLKPYTDCTKYNDVDLKYQLYAIVVHTGRSPMGGHYYCYIRASPDTWHKLDDEHVTRLEEQDVLTESPYILFYAREDTPWFSTFFASEEFLADPSISNESPKSVLDNADGVCQLVPDSNVVCPSNPDVSESVPESSIACPSHLDVSNSVPEDINGGCTSDPNVAYPDNCEASISREGVSGTTSAIPFELNDVEMSPREDSKKATVEIPASLSQDSPMRDVFVQTRADEEDNRKQGSDSIGRSKPLQPSILHRSSLPEAKTGRMQEARYSTLQHQKKVENRVGGKRLSTRRDTRDPKRKEAMKYVQSQMRGSRASGYFDALKFSPCKRASPPGSRRKHLRSVVGVMR